MRRLYIFISISTIILTILVHLGWNQGWVLGLLGLGFPVLMIFHLVAFFFILFFSPRLLGWSALVFVFLMLLLPRTYQLGEVSTDIDSVEHNEITVLSYNVGNYSKTEKAAAEYKAWLTSQGADVLLLPEYSNYNLAHHGTLAFIHEHGYPYHHTLQHQKHKALINTAGLTVFSRHPILFARDTLFQNLNGIVQVDLAVGKDTVSFFGVHLYSMSLEIDKIVKKKKRTELEKEGLGLMQKIKKGFVYRQGEVDLLSEWTRQAKHPVIVGGDFNETPYSYSYSRLRNRFANAFEEGGKGFGFTFNSLPYFIRIDQQFYDSSQLELLEFKTFRNIYFSDHFPLLGVYRLKGTQEK